MDICIYVTGLLDNRMYTLQTGVPLALTTWNAKETRYYVEFLHNNAKHFNDYPTKSWVSSTAPENYIKAVAEELMATESD